MRIISGQHRGRKLLPPEGRVTRPITDRVKESLFAILTPWLPDAAVVDLFCGTGSMGLEALSRGAAHCWFADRDRKALDRLQRNIATLGVEAQTTVLSGDILARLDGWLGELDRRVDIVFLDPPYPMARQWRDDPAAGRRAAAGVFAPLAAAVADDGLVVFRTPRNMPAPDPVGGLVCRRRKEYGSMALNFMGRPDDGDASADEESQAP